MNVLKTWASNRFGNACLSTVLFGLSYFILGRLFDSGQTWSGTLLSSLIFFAWMFLTFPMLKRWQRP